MKLLVLDGNSIVNRAFYGIKMLTTKDGRYTNALVGFMNILLKLEAEVKPDEVAVAFDLKAPTFRHKMYDGYKAQRKGMPQELAGQLPVLKQLLAGLGYRMVTCEGFEADDILGTLSAACEARGDECVIATGDRDSPVSYTHLDVYKRQPQYWAISTPPPDARPNEQLITSVCIWLPRFAPEIATSPRLPSITLSISVTPKLMAYWLSLIHI